MRAAIAASSVSSIGAIRAGGSALKRCADAAAASRRERRDSLAAEVLRCGFAEGAAYPQLCDWSALSVLGVYERRQRYVHTCVHLLSAFLRAKDPIDKRKRSEFPQ